MTGTGAAVQIGGGEATEEPALIRQSKVTTAREYLRRAGRAARPTETAKCTGTRIEPELAVGAREPLP